MTESPMPGTPLALRWCGEELLLLPERALWWPAQRVLMIAEQGGVEARTMGEAMKKGRKGEMIKVKNESSERVVSAIVADAGVVKMVYASGN